MGLSEVCATDAVLGDSAGLPPSIARPRRGHQAKRRAHATLVDHLIQTWLAPSVGDLAKAEKRLDEYAVSRP